MAKLDTARKASKAFYAALNGMAQGDSGPMLDIWLHNATVTTMHPIGGREIGWAKIKEPWEQISKISSGGKIGLYDQLIRIGGEMAYEVGVERGHITLGGIKVKFEHRVTNVYRNGASGWKIVHHHADISPAMLDALKRLKAEK